jgi:hypothetical protein
MTLPPSAGLSLPFQQEHLTKVCRVRQGKSLWVPKKFRWVPPVFRDVAGLPQGFPPASARHPTFVGHLSQKMVVGEGFEPPFRPNLGLNRV